MLFRGLVGLDVEKGWNRSEGDGAWGSHKIGDPRPLFSGNLFGDPPSLHFREIGGPFVKKGTP